MVILDGRCLCVGSCCCLDLPVPKLDSSKESYKAPPCLQAIKVSSQRSLASEETRADDRSSRTTSRDASGQWIADVELTGSGLQFYRTRRFVAMPTLITSDDEYSSAEERSDGGDSGRAKIRRAFFDEGTCHW
mmetsp:Transcript_66175/g.157921  ORF Transcript_66175/g.157921 Transcript_66175/m.157921 type:complete len:133 (-) Transcript_66175:101-499(-)|eukprot:CAMPEP_0181412676 /NCGR_PEP_ID=MMETSP1110-20121109/8555_1 /TAXON_ID=174948 /ORGANISM="Symbiodinium sp., Strain CCMP421" /LENGTH=132 /DNA_ID=CAMNT_0023535417 /DNA_START=39 /DNA_END=437 /DNA_ORIENTATION=+